MSIFEFYVLRYFAHSLDPERGSGAFQISSLFSTDRTRRLEVPLLNISCIFHLTHRHRGTRTSGSDSRTVEPTQISQVSFVEVFKL